MQVDEPREEHEAVGGEALDAGRRVGGGVRADRGDQAVADQDVGAALAEDVGAEDQQVAHAATSSPASRW